MSYWRTKLRTEINYCLYFIPGILLLLISSFRVNNFFPKISPILFICFSLNFLPDKDGYTWLPPPDICLFNLFHQPSSAYCFSRYSRESADTPKECPYKQRQILSYKMYIPDYVHWIYVFPVLTRYLTKYFNDFRLYL